MRCNFERLNIFEIFLLSLSYLIFSKKKSLKIMFSHLFSSLVKEDREITQGSWKNKNILSKFYHGKYLFKIVLSFPDVLTCIV